MKLGPARPRDARALARILAEWHAETGWLSARPDRRGDRRALGALIARAHVLTLRDWCGPVGFVAREGATLHALYLRPGQRRRGHGQRLLDAAKAQSRRLTLWTPAANLEARAFYTREGFSEVGWGDGSGNDAGVPEVRLEWQRGDTA